MKTANAINLLFEKGTKIFFILGTISLIFIVYLLIKVTMNADQYSPFMAIAEITFAPMLLFWWSWYYGTWSKEISFRKRKQIFLREEYLDKVREYFDFCKDWSVVEVEPTSNTADEFKNNILGITASIYRSNIAALSLVRNFKLHTKLYG